MYPQPLRNHRWLTRVVTVLTLAAAAVAVVAAPASAAAVVYHRTSSWATGYVGEFTITNDTAGPLVWRVEFDLPAGTTAAAVWGATITATTASPGAATHYTAAGTAWNSTLTTATSATFGFVASGTDDPIGCLVGGVPCSGTDTTAPSTPGNLRVQITTDQVIFFWDPSTDDVGVVGYEVFRQNALIATTTAPTVAVARIPQYGMFVISVRAFDAAGNRSDLRTGGVAIDGPPPSSQAPSVPPPGSQTPLPSASGS